jgi:hypothetical protein
LSHDFGFTQLLNRDACRPGSALFMGKERQLMGFDMRAKLQLVCVAILLETTDIPAGSVIVDNGDRSAEFAEMHGGI